MSANPTVCGNCGTENPPGTDECVKCGMPLTRSGGQELRAEVDAENERGAFGLPAEATYARTWPAVPPPADPPSRPRH